jgi:hypothetical protein
MLMIDRIRKDNKGSFRLRGADASIGVGPKRAALVPASSFPHTALHPPIAPIALRRSRPLGALCLESANNELNQVLGVGVCQL